MPLRRLPHDFPRAGRAGTAVVLEGAMREPCQSCRPPCPHRPDATESAAGAVNAATSPDVASDLRGRPGANAVGHRGIQLREYVDDLAVGEYRAVQRGVHVLQRRATALFPEMLGQHLQAELET